MEDIFITFIIPTIGRESLLNSIQSLLDQDDNNWNAFIIFDGVKNNDLININDNRIKIIEIEKIEGKIGAGLVRNYGLNQELNSEWIGFLDDDDILSKDYISKLKEEINLNPVIEVCIFRMAYNNGCILPNKSLRNITIGRVGISFAIKKYISKNIKFKNSKCEDYLFLRDIQNNKNKIIISSYTTYFIRTNPFKCELYPKILINFP
jgi:cellulose synthase/poly-beta-1,6-N-acetylglucosamine synthase-like glycosyltransferase